MPGESLDSLSHLESLSSFESMTHFESLTRFESLTHFESLTRFGIYFDVNRMQAGDSINMFTFSHFRQPDIIQSNCMIRKFISERTMNIAISFKDSSLIQRFTPQANYKSDRENSSRFKNLVFSDLQLFLMNDLTFIQISIVYVNKIKYQLIVKLTD